MPPLVSCPRFRIPREPVDAGVVPLEAVSNALDRAPGGTGKGVLLDLADERLSVGKSAQRAVAKFDLVLGGEGQEAASRERRRRRRPAVHGRRAPFPKEGEEGEEGAIVRALHGRADEVDRGGLAEAGEEGLAVLADGVHAAAAAGACPGFSQRYVSFRIEDGKVGAKGAGRQVEPVGELIDGGFALDAQREHDLAARGGEEVEGDEAGLVAGPESGAGELVHFNTSAGTRTAKTVPPGLDVTRSSSPPSASMAARAEASPRPVPETRVVK